VTAAGLRRPRLQLTAPSGELVRAILAFVIAAVVAGTLVGGLATDNGVWVCAGLLGAIAPMLALPRHRVRDGVELAVAVWVGSIAIAVGFPQVYNPGPSVTHAVGAAAYFGTPYQGQQVAILVALALLVGAAVAYRLVRARPAPPGAAVASPLPRPDRATVLLLAVAVVVVALTLLPDFHDRLLGPLDQVSGNDWDVANVTTWGWLELRGALPMRDFFFPYGGTWLFGRYPWGPVIEWLYQLVVIGLFGWALWRLSGGRTVRVVLCLLALAPFAVFATGIWRYGPALAPALCFAALGPARHTRLTWGHAVLGLACLVTAFTGPDILGLYALAAVVLVAFGEWLRVRKPWRVWARGLAIDAIPLVLAAVLLVLSWLATGTFEGNVRLWLHLSAASAGYALNEVDDGALAHVGLSPTLGSLAIALPFLLVAAGIVQSLWNRDGDRGTGPILLAAGAIGFVTLGKVMVRPVGTQLELVPILALTWSAILLCGTRALLATAASGAALGAMVPLVQSTQDTLGTYLSRAIDAPRHVVRSASVLGEGDAIAKRSGELFGSYRLAKVPEVGVANTIRAATRGNIPRVATLGDSALIYPLLNQTPPYHVNFYDSSPIAEQQKMLSELKRMDPGLLVWNHFWGTDNMSYWIRDPLIFTWAVEHYTPVGQAPGDTFLLARRAPNQPVQYDWWRARFPSPLDLGYVPSESDGASLDGCSGGAGCVPYAIVRGRPSGRGQWIIITVNGNGGDYPVLMRQRPEVDTYAVRLDRLWFWPIIGPAPRVTSSTPGFSVRVERKQAGDRLY
jgi:hypothetical protein